MTEKERAHASLEGREVDRSPVTVLYNMLYYQDHFAELTGRPQWEQWLWRYADPDAHVALYRELLALAPFELLQPQGCPSREERESTRLVERDGRHFIHSTRTDALIPTETVSGHPTDDRYNEIQHIRDEAEAREKIRPARAEDLLAAGHNDYLDAMVAALGDDHFILSGGLAGAFWTAHFHVGLTNLLLMAVERPSFVDLLCARCLEQNIESIRQLAAAGGDAIYLDDAIATSDMISVAHYERFCLPYMTEMVREVQRLGHKAIVIYYGGVMDRLDLVKVTVSTAKYSGIATSNNSTRKRARDGPDRDAEGTGLTIYRQIASDLPELRFLRGAGCARPKPPRRGWASLNGARFGARAVAATGANDARSDGPGFTTRNSMLTRNGSRPRVSHRVWVIHDSARAVDPDPSSRPRSDGAHRWLGLLMSPLRFEGQLAISSQPNASAAQPRASVHRGATV